MKKFLSLIICIILSLSFVGCDQQKKSDNSKKTVVATIFPLYDFAKNIVGDKMNVQLLIKPGSSSHDFANNVSVKDLADINDGDMFIYCGGESDKWLEDDDVFKTLESNSIVCAMDLVKKYEEEAVEGMQSEDDEEEASKSNEKEYDEHVWTNPKNAELISKKISDIACNIDRENSSYYKNNLEIYSSKLKKLDNSFEDTINKSKRKTIVVADRFPFRYLAERYSLSYAAAFPGCSSSTEVSLSTLNYLVDKIKSEKIPVVFYTDGSSKIVCSQVVKETNTKMLLLHSCHDISKAEFEAGEDYISIMESNLKNLSEALN